MDHNNIGFVKQNFAVYSGSYLETEWDKVPIFNVFTGNSDLYQPSKLCSDISHETHAVICASECFYMRRCIVISPAIINRLPTRENKAIIADLSVGIIYCKE